VKGKNNKVIHVGGWWWWCRGGAAARWIDGGCRVAGWRMELQLETAGWRLELQLETGGWRLEAGVAGVKEGYGVDKDLNHPL